MLLAADVQAGDILRGNAGGGSSRRNADARAGAGATEANVAKAKAQDRLARTSKAIQAVRNMQNGATSTPRVVPDGLTQDGLKVLSGANARWDGADAPYQVGNTVTVRQNQSQAVLHWETFNVGRKTTLKFDQSKGGDDAGKWVAFNKVFDPSKKPSQILGSIKAEGQVYIINQNGIIFGAGSQVNVRALVASTLPINDNLINRGLLDNPDAQFLFSNKLVTGGNNTANFDPSQAPYYFQPTDVVQDITVESGAVIRSTASNDGNGGRVMLVGANVYNNGIIDTPSGQTILAAGLQVGIDSHYWDYPNLRTPRTGQGDDASLRGLDVYIGDVGTYAGKVVQNGLIEIPKGSFLMVGKNLIHNGVVESMTTVDLNGRVDFLANYNAIQNPNYNATTRSGGAPFIYGSTGDSTGSITMGAGSVISILPDLVSGKTIPGIALPLRSQVNLLARDIYFKNSSMILAPNADITLGAGQWIIQDNRNKFVYYSGNIIFDSGSLLDASGTVDAIVPITSRIVDVVLRGAELISAPLQREGSLRGISITVDLTRTGTYGGRRWVGTPLADLTGVESVVQRTAAELMSAGGSVYIKSGGSVVVNKGSTIDVSGGYLQYTGGNIRTTKLIRGSALINIDDALPGTVYDGIYSGTTSSMHAKWGIMKNYALPLSPTGAYPGSNYIAGADGGELVVQAPSMILNGELKGQTIVGPRQMRESSSSLKSSRPEYASLSLLFKSNDPTNYAGFGLSGDNLPPYKGPVSKTIIVIGSQQAAVNAGETVMNIAPNFYETSGFGSVTIENSEGEIVIPAGETLRIADNGSFNATASKVSIHGNIVGAGASVDLIAYNISPYLATILKADPASPQLPQAVAGAGIISLSANSVIDVSGRVQDDRTLGRNENATLFATTGGDVSLKGYSVDLAEGSRINVSGGLATNVLGKYKYGSAGAITIKAGQDPSLTSLMGGTLALNAVLEGYSGTQGGTLAITAPHIRIGEVTSSSPRMLSLSASFFSQGGFASFELTGIGSQTTDPDVFKPAIEIAPGTTIAPIVQSLVNGPFKSKGKTMLIPIDRPVGLRNPVSLTFNAPGVTASLAEQDPVNGVFLVKGSVKVRGEIFMPESSLIRTDPLGSVTFDGQIVSIEGQIYAPAGTITIKGADSFPTNDANPLIPRPTVYLGPRSILSAAGSQAVIIDKFGRRRPIYKYESYYVNDEKFKEAVGTALEGGSISVSGNMVLAKGSLLDVSGSGAMLDLAPNEIGTDQDPTVPVHSGLTSMPYLWNSSSQIVYGAGGAIALEGGQFLFSSADLVGRPGGPGAAGGSLSVSSGKFHRVQTYHNSAEIDLIVSNNLLSFGALGNLSASAWTSYVNGLTVSNPTVATNGFLGYFDPGALSGSGFETLELGGNVRFSGPLTLSMKRQLAVGSGGVIEADSVVRLQAPYLRVGRDFEAARNSGDALQLFTQTDANDTTTAYYFAPTTGPGSITFEGSLIDVGSVSLNKINFARMSASGGGDIRGNGYLQMDGRLELDAGQIYPTTGAEFGIFVYGANGSVTISRSGMASGFPLSAAGSLTIQASQIFQGGVLRAPLGRIVLGWDGTGDAPKNPLASAANVTVPVTASIVMQPGSLTSVSLVDDHGQPVLIPYGMSTDGISWIDPSGKALSDAYFPAKSISISGTSVSFLENAIIDIQGGGDIYATYWKYGTGGDQDILGTAAASWSSSTAYKVGDLVLYQGRTYSARAANTGKNPSSGRYWSYVPESYAILPDSGYKWSAYAAFNSGSNAQLLDGDGGYVSSRLNVGDSVWLGDSQGLKGGYYTLFPARYALYPGAALVTPRYQTAVGSILQEDGVRLVSGYFYNGFDSSRRTTAIQSSFEIATSAVVANLAEYTKIYGMDFLNQAAEKNGTEMARGPADAGYLSFQAGNAMRIEGSVLSQSLADGRGAMVDISSTSAITIAGAGIVTSANPIVLSAAKLSALGAESLLIGGVRSGTAGASEGSLSAWNVNLWAGTNSSSVSNVSVKTSSLTVDNAGTPLAGPEILLVAKDVLTLNQGAQIQSSGSRSETSDVFALTGPSAALLVSSDQKAAITRSGSFTSSSPLLSIGDDVKIAGQGIVMDSTSRFDLSQTAVFAGNALTFGAGQISILLQNAPLTGSIIPQHLVFQDDALRSIQTAQSLTLIAYQQSIDTYGSGVFGSDTLKSLTLKAGEIRGFNQGAGTVSFKADSITLQQQSGASRPGPMAGAPVSGTLAFHADKLTLGNGTLYASQFDHVVLNALTRVNFDGEGSFNAQNALTVNTPVLTSSDSASHGLKAGGEINVVSSGAPGLLANGKGGSVSIIGSKTSIASNIILPGGSITIGSTGANVSDDVTISGILDVSGRSQVFQDLIRYYDGGTVSLSSASGDVVLAAGSIVSVAADSVAGNAGTLAISSPKGSFVLDGTILGAGGSSGTSGQFKLDAGSVASFADLADALNDGHFYEARTFRIRDAVAGGKFTVDGTSTARKFELSVDQASLSVTGTINASGPTGGSISLVATGDVVLEAGSRLSVAGDDFSNAGKGGDVTLEAGAERNGVAGTGSVKILSGSVIDLSVASKVAGDSSTVGSSAYNGQFSGTLHIRAPQNATHSDLLVEAIDGMIIDPSSILVEGYRLYDLTDFGGTITSDVQARILSDGQTFLGTAGTTTANYTSMMGRLLANNSSLAGVTVIAPGAEVINTASPASLNYTMAPGSTITLPSIGGSVILPSGTQGNTITSSVAGTITSSTGQVTTLAANTNTVIAAGSTVTLATAGTITLVSGGASSVPITLSSGSTFTASATGVSGTVSARGSTVSLTAANTSSITLAAGAKITFPNGTPGASRIRSTVAGTITSSTGVVTALAANTVTTIPAGSYVTLNSAGTITATSVSGGAVAVALASGSFTTSGPVAVTPATGDLTLGALASTSTSDWDLASYRFGAKSAPGVLTLRAAGNVVFYNTLSDGFQAVASTAANGNSTMWMATPMTQNLLLPTNTQSWSYTIAAGADLSAANRETVRRVDDPALAANKGFVIVGKLPTASGTTPGSSGPTATGGNNALTSSAVAAGFYQVIRTGTGNIDIAAGRSVQLRNELATIYTAGVQVNNPNSVYGQSFQTPVLVALGSTEVGNLGVDQQTYQAFYTMAGGNITIDAGMNIEHVTINRVNSGFTPDVFGLIPDSTRQLPTNWLYRRGAVNSAGVFAEAGLENGDPIYDAAHNDPSASTTWWIDFSNFFEGIGALGGGNITLIAGKDVSNVDALIPTNARMPSGTPNASALLELGGGDLVVSAGRNIDAGVYYIENGNGVLHAGANIVTNATRSASRGLLLTTSSNSGVPDYFSDPSSWLATTLFLGKGGFTVSALGDITLGPIANPFLLPQGLGNKYYYKTYFTTYDADSYVKVSSLGGDITYSLEISAPNQSGSFAALATWYDRQLKLASTNASFLQPWLRIVETNISAFGSSTQNPSAVAASLMPASIYSTAFSGDINIAGDMVLSPSATGTLELLAEGSINGIQPTGTRSTGVRLWTESQIIVSDASPANLPTIVSPIAFQMIVGNRTAIDLRQSQFLFNGVAKNNFLQTVLDSYFAESGSTEQGFSTKRALHSSGQPLHANDIDPLRLYAQSGNISGFTLYSPKVSRILAGADIMDIAFYLQNVSDEDISVVAAGGNIVLYKEDTPLRKLAGATGNQIIATNSQKRSLPGDIQISGPGTLEVLAGMDLDLGLGASLAGDLGSGITSIGNARNNTLPFMGASIIVAAGIGPSMGLAKSSLNFEELGANAQTAGGSLEENSILLLESFFKTLIASAGEAAMGGSYDTGFAAISTLFGEGTYGGNLDTRLRNIRTKNGGDITILVPGGGISMAEAPPADERIPPGIVTEYGGAISIFTNEDVEIGYGRIFTLRGGDLVIWSSEGDIAAGSSSKYVVTAPPTRVLLDPQSANVQTDLSGLATGGGIGVLASVEGVPPGDVNLIAPNGTVDAGDAGIRATGNITIAAVTVLNADNISASGSTVGVPVTPVAAAPNIAGLSSAGNATAATSNAAQQVANQARPQTEATNQAPSIISVEVLGYGGGEE